MKVTSAMPAIVAAEQHLGFRLKDFQIGAVSALLDGRDVMLSAPTGSGKTAIYQAACLATRDRGCTVVLSPLIALIRDQQRRMDEMGIPCASFYGQVPRAERRYLREQVDSGEIDIVLTTPETLGLDRGLRSALIDRTPLLVVDEGHAYEEWAHSFRPAYRRIGGVAKTLGAERILICSATLSAVAAAEAAEAFDRWDWEVLCESPSRPNLQYVGCDWVTQWDMLAWMKRQRVPGIIYTTAARSASRLQETAIIATDLEVDLYHGKLPRLERNTYQRKWMEGRRWMIATKAFGMGIDRPDVRTVAHSELPTSVSDYAQESGRAGRDGEQAICALNRSDSGRVAEFLVEQGYPSVERVKAVYQAYSDAWEHVSIREIGLRTDLKPETVRAARGWLIGVGMMETRPANRDWLLEIDDLGIMGLPVGKSGKRMREAIKAIKTVCRKTENGLAATSDEIAGAMEATYRDWRAALRRLEDRGALRAAAPSRVGQNRRRGLWSDFRADRLVRARDRAKRKLAEMRVFARLPDEERATEIEHAIRLDASEAEEEIRWRREDAVRE